jgi:OPA family glycerol-3-phosphate transporter-like MFS transporter
MSQSRSDNPELNPLSIEQHVWRTKVLVSTFLGYSGFYLCRKVFGLVKKPLSDEFGWEIDSIAYIWAVYLFMYMIGQFVNGFVGRKWGPRVLLLGGLGISIGCNLIFGATSSYYVLFGFMAMNGLVQAGGWPGSVGSVSHWIRPSERGTLMGAWGTSYIFGNIITKLVGTTLLAMGLAAVPGKPLEALAGTEQPTGLAAIPGWRLAFFGCTLLAGLIWLLLYFWQRNKPEDAGLPPIVDPDADEAGRAIQKAKNETATFKDYLSLATDPLIVSMGVGYFFIKFLRYALDSWLPTFLAFQGLTPAEAGRFSMGFDIGGIIPSVFIGFVLDRYFRGNWAKVCMISGIGLSLGYVCVLIFETNPVMAALSFALVGFMLYGPDTLLVGASSVSVAGERNGVAIAGLVNCIGSIGPIVQELVIGKILNGYENKLDGIHFTNKMALCMSIMFAIMMFVTMWRVRTAHAQNAAAQALK